MAKLVVSDAGHGGSDGGATGNRLREKDLTLAICKHLRRKPEGGENSVQRALIEEALTARPLPASRRGVAPTLQGLAGTWATDPEYADKISRIANEIRSMS